MNGWIKLNKRIRKHWLWDHPDYFRAWVDMLMMANWKETKKLYKDEIIVIERGEFPTSIRKLAERWNMAINTVNKLLKLLKKDTMIDTHSDYGFTTIKINNYEKYQTRLDTPRDTVSDTLADTVSDTTIRYIKNNKTIKNNNIVRFDSFWNLYDKKINREKCLSKWNRLSNKDKDAIFDHLPNYIASTPDKQYRKNPLTYLNNRGWDDVVILPKQKLTNTQSNVKKIMDVELP